MVEMKMDGTAAHLVEEEIDPLGDEALDRPGPALGCAGPMCVFQCISQKG